MNNQTSVLTLTELLEHLDELARKGLTTAFDQTHDLVIEKIVNRDFDSTDRTKALSFLEKPETSLGNLSTSNLVELIENN